MAMHRIPATPETVRWGVFDAAIPPVITIASGDTVVLECVSGGPDAMFATAGDPVLLQTGGKLSTATGTFPHRQT